MARRDGGEADLVWSLDLYESLGVPVERTLLGLPLYGITWPVAGPALGEARTGDGDTWVPADNPARHHLAGRAARDGPDRDRRLLRHPTRERGRRRTRATGRPPPVGARSTSTRPATLTTKLALADDRGLAGAGFWAIGYERGLPGYDDLIARFRAGQVADSVARVG